MKEIKQHLLKDRKQSPDHIKKRVEARRRNGTYKGLMGKDNPSFGKPSWNKGKKGLQKHSEESKEKMRQAKLGKKQTEEHKQNSVIARMKLAEEKGYYKPNSERSKKLSTKLKGRVINENWRKKLSDAWDYDKHVTPESREKQRIARLSQVFPKKDSKPEKLMQLALQKEGIKFDKHKKLIGQPDIFIEPNLCVFVDGDYWHCNPIRFKADQIVYGGLKVSEIWEYDNKITHTLSEQGYVVMRFWTSFIKKAENKWANHVIQTIKDHAITHHQINLKSL